MFSSFSKNQAMHFSFLDERSLLSRLSCLAKCIYVWNIRSLHWQRKSQKWNKEKAASLMTSWHVQIWGSSSMWITTMWILLRFRIEAELRYSKQNDSALIYTCAQTCSSPWDCSFMHRATCGLDYLVNVVQNLSDFFFLSYHHDTFPSFGKATNRKDCWI